MPEQYGATLKEWITFDVIFGLTEDLLPVVSNPNAEISILSKLKEKGKVPSRYNSNRKVAGIEKWSGHITSPHEIKHWMRERDYGICVQTRHVRALDVDVPDMQKSDAILNFLKRYFKSIELPYRYRLNSGKFLAAFRMEGEIPKRTVKVDGGMIEFLGNGQQFVAAGMHPSGVRYEWYHLSDFPVLTLPQFEKLWNALVTTFAVEQPRIGHLRQPGETRNMKDDVLKHLEITGWGPQGQAHINCPFAYEHTAETSESSTSYFPAGTNGYELGHFVCLHAHCANRTNEDFLDALGLRAKEFETLEGNTPVRQSRIIPSSPDRRVSLVWPSFKRDGSGQIYPIIDNLYHALRRDDVCAAHIAYDRFRDEILITSDKSHALMWRPLADNDYTILQRHMERFVGFKPISLDLLRRAVQLVAFENTFDSAQLWLEGLEYDGVPRVDTFMSRYMRAEDSPYSTAVSRYLWSALAGRILLPGVKADMALIWESEEGRIKSATIEALAPDPEFFLEVDLSEDEEKLARKMRGKLVAEISELRGLNTKDEQSILAFISRRVEEWIPKYQEKSRRFARRFIFIATTNEKEILPAGRINRRWLPSQVGMADIEAIIRDRDQLWAEGRELFRKFGVCYRDAEITSIEARKEYVRHHPWDSVINEWLNTPEDMGETLPAAKGYVTMAEVMQNALQLDKKNMKGNDSKEIAKILRSAGFERRKIYTEKRMDWVWAKTPKE